MSEVASRSSASRGRGSGRGGRGGFTGRGGRSRTNGDRSDHKDDSLGAFEDEGDFAELRKQYGNKTAVIREMFPDWSEADVLFALQETHGDENEAVARIAEGTISQWGEVSKVKKTARAKVKDGATPTINEISAPRAPRGGRNVSEGGRGRGRGSERGGRGGSARGRSTQPTSNGPRKESQPLSVPTEESAAYKDAQTSIEKPEVQVAADRSVPGELSKPAAPAAKTWASMLRQTTAPKPPPLAASKETSTPKPAESEPQAIPEISQPDNQTAETLEEETTPVAQSAVPAQSSSPADNESLLLPSRDELTETNLEQVVDVSQPPATGTAASTAADSWDPRQSPVSATATPISAAHQQHQAHRPMASGFAASAIKATAERPVRTPSYQRRILDQEEAVRMPGNRDVDRAAVKFGAFSLTDGDEDVDGEREEPETRAQPPADSPIAHPRTSLPPAAQPVAVPEPFAQKTGAAPSAATGAVPTGPAAATQLSSNVPQYGRFGPHDSTSGQKPLDAFSAAQSTPASQPSYDNYSASTSQTPAHQQQPGSAFTSAQGDYSNYYSANQQERTSYNIYGQQYGAQQGAQAQHEGASQQRPFAGYNNSDSLSQYPQSGSLHNQPRFSGSNDSQNSGHSTPNPTAQVQQQGQQHGQHGQQGQQSQQGPQGQQQSQQSQTSQHGAAPGSQPQSHGQYPGYNHPYYNNPYYHQYYSGYGQQGGFGPYGGKAGMYGQPYGMSPNAPYDHNSSQNSFGGPGSLHRDNSLGSGVGDYGRSGTGQGGSQPSLGGSNFGGSHDSFGRGGASSFQSQGQPYNSQSQPPAPGSNDDLKFGDAKTNVSGPSASLGGGPRPGSAANNASGAQAGLPPPQTSQMGGGYGGYPNHLQGHNAHGSGYGMGGGAGNNQHGSSPYGSYGQGFGGSGGYYGGNQQQQRGGWGGNYH